MKRITALMLIVVMLISVFTCYVNAGTDYIIPNPPITVDVASPTVDGDITDTEGWSSVAYMNEDTLRIHRHSRSTILGELRFAVDTSGFYFSGDFKVGVLSYDPTYELSDNSAGKILSDVGENGRCDFSGDSFKLTIDPLCALSELTNYYHCLPTYTLSLCADGKVYMYDRDGMLYDDIGPITGKGALAEGKLTEDGWCFEAWIPWSMIVDSVKELSDGKLSLNINDIAMHGSKIKAGGIYTDRYPDSFYVEYTTAPAVLVGGLKKPGYMFSNVELDTLGIELTVSDTCNDGIRHRWTDPIILCKPTYLEMGRKMILCNRCGETRYENIEKRSCVDEFTDIRENAWYFDGVAYCIGKGYMKGMGPAVFSPHTTMTREQSVLILANIMGVNTDEYKNIESGFSDVPTGKWYSGAVVWAKQKGIVEGISEDKFGTGQNIQRAAFIRLLYMIAEELCMDRTAQADMSVYADRSDIPGWASKGISWAVANKIIVSTKTDAMVISPYSELTRAQAAVMLAKFDEIK